jgi:hypothetical protein
MKRRIIGAFLFIGSISGCISTSEPETGGVRANYGQSSAPPTVPGVSGPYGEKFPMQAPFNSAPPGSQWAALNMMNANVPMSAVQMNPGGTMTPPGVMGMPGTMPGMPGLPGPGPRMPAGFPGGMPGMPGGMPGMPGGMPGMPGAMGGNPFLKTSASSMSPDSGLMNANIPPGASGPGGVTNAQFAASSPTGPLFPAQRTQVFFSKPAGMKIFWFSQGADGKPSYSNTPLETPGRYNFAQAAIYRLKLTHIPGRPALELYPTLEVVPTSPKTNEFLAHNSVPVEFTDEDFKQVVDKNYIVKVIYLPDPQFQDAAGAGPDEIVSTRLEPGQDPIQEALRRGSILMVLRIGNIDQGLNHSPAMTAPVPGGPPAMMKPPGQGVPPLFQVPMPLQPITPGGVGVPPNALPPFPGGNPPVLNLPAPPLPGKTEIAPPLPGKTEVAPPLPGKIDPIPTPKKDAGNKLFVPQLNLPAPPGLKVDDSVKPNLPTIPSLPPSLTPSIDKGSKIDVPLPKSPVIPASTSNESAPQLPSVALPPLPAIDLTTPSRPELPIIPALPGGKR